MQGTWKQLYFLLVFVRRYISRFSDILSACCSYLKMQSVWSLSYSEVWSECHPFFCSRAQPAGNSSRHCRFTAKTPMGNVPFCGDCTEVCKEQVYEMRGDALQKDLTEHKIVRNRWDFLWITLLNCFRFEETYVFIPHCVTWNIDLAIDRYHIFGRMDWGRPIRKHCTRSVPLLPDSSFSWQISMEMV